MRFIKNTFLIISLLLIFHGKDVELGTGSDSVKVKIMGHSGKISIKNINSTEEVTIDFSSLSEKDDKDQEVGKSGAVKHTFTTFASLDFTFSEISDTKFQNLNATKVTMTATSLVDPATTFIGSVYLFREKGQIDMGNGENWDVDIGTVKFSSIISDWPFCEDPCTGSHCCKEGQKSQVGKYLDFQIGIKGKQVPVKDSSTFNLGNSKLIVASNVNSDEVWGKMETGYPKFENDVFTFRFPKAKKSIVYDPMVSFIEQSSNAWWISILVIMGLVAIGVGIFFIVKCSGKKDENKASLNLGNQV